MIDWMELSIPSGQPGGTHPSSHTWTGRSRSVQQGAASVGW
jgi:hypothetical protein